MSKLLIVDNVSTRRASERAVSKMNSIIEAWGTDKCLSELAKKTGVQNAYEARSKALWRALTKDTETVLIFVSNRFQWDWDKQLQQTVSYCFHHGVTAILADLSAFCQTVKVAPHDNPLPRRNFDFQSWTPWNNAKRELEENLVALETDIGNVLVYNQLSRDNMAMMSTLGVKQLPAMDIIEGVVQRDAPPYEVSVTVDVRKPVLGFQNTGSLTSGHENWRATGFRDQPVDELSERLRINSTVQVWLMITYFKRNGFMPDSSQYKMCEMCGQWYSISAEHCTQCDCPNPDVVELEYHDFLSSVGLDEYDVEDALEQREYFYALETEDDEA